MHATVPTGTVWRVAFCSVLSLQDLPPEILQKTDPLSPLKHRKRICSGRKPRKRKNEKAIFGGIGELGVSGWRRSIRLVKLVWLLLPKKLGNGGKRPNIPKKIIKRKKSGFSILTPADFILKTCHLL